jgi:hypothetical protein
MAKDLIPPPSPAGRPEPESSESLGRIADGLWSGGDEPRAARQAEPDAGAARQDAQALGHSPYRSRFGFVVGALVGIAIVVAALGSFVALNASEEPAPDGWSPWHPAGSDVLETAQQIADHVAVKYRLDDKQQLVAIRASGLELAGRPLSVATRAASDGGDIQLLEGDGVMYMLTGLGKNGSIRRGKPSEERHLLLRREALELSLYTFHYADDVDMVVTLLPPSPDAPASAGGLPELRALLFRPGDLQGELGVPLETTVPPQTPRPAQIDLKTSEAKRIDALTLSNLFTGSFRQSQDASLFLVLER